MPRGVIRYEEEDGDSSRSAKPPVDKMKEILPAPPTLLPEVIPSSHSCNYCYSNSECMLYARCDIELSRGGYDDTRLNNMCNAIEKSHAQLLHHFTGHLNNKDLSYFRDWDRMIDLEAQDYKNALVKAWLRPSNELEKASLTCVSSVTWDSEFDERSERSRGAPTTLLKFDRQTGVKYSLTQMSMSRLCSESTPLTALNIDPNDIVVVSTDGSIYRPNTTESPTNRPIGFRNKMHIVRGTVQSITESSICIIASRQDRAQLKQLTDRWYEVTEKNVPKGSVTGEGLFFRIDKDEISGGAGVLRRNLANLFLSDVPAFSLDRKKKKQLERLDPEDPPFLLQRRLSRLRDCIINFTAEPIFDAAQQLNLFSSPDDSAPTVSGCDFMDLVMEYVELNEDQKNAVMKVSEQLYWYITSRLKTSCVALHTLTLNSCL